MVEYEPMYPVQKGSYTCISLHRIENACISQSSFSASSCTLATFIIKFFFLFLLDINARRHYQRNTVIVGEKGGVNHTVCKPISEAESRKSEHRQNSLSVSGELAGTTQVNI